MKKTLAWTLVFAMTFGMILLPANAAAPAAKTQQVSEANRKPTPPRQDGRPGPGSIANPGNKPGKPAPAVKPSQPGNKYGPSQGPSRPQQNVHRPQPSRPGPANNNHYYAQSHRPQPHKPAPSHSYRPGYGNSSGSWWSAGVGAIIGSFIGSGLGGGW